LKLGLSSADATVGDGVTAPRRAVRVDADLRITNAADGRILTSKEVAAKMSRVFFHMGMTCSAANDKR
jgi:hypothetical protein